MKSELLITFTRTLPGLYVKSANLPVLRGLEAYVDSADAQRLISAGLAVPGAQSDNYS